MNTHRISQYRLQECSFLVKVLESDPRFVLMQSSNPSAVCTQYYVVTKDWSEYPYKRVTPLIHYNVSPKTGHGRLQAQQGDFYGLSDQEVMIIQGEVYREIHGGI